MGVFLVFEIVQMVGNRAKHHIYVMKKTWEHKKNQQNKKNWISILKIHKCILIHCNEIHNSPLVRFHESDPNQIFVCKDFRINKKWLDGNAILKRLNQA